MKFVKPFTVIFERFVKIGEVMSPRPVVSAVLSFGQVADGNVGAGIVLPHEQGEVALIRSVAKYDGEPHGVVFEPESRFYGLYVKPLHELPSFRKGYRIYGTAGIGTGKRVCTIRSSIPSSRYFGA